VLAFIDDAGDPGFKFSRASSRYFVIACVIFDENADAEATAQLIREFRAEKHWKPQHELKFHTMRKDVVKEFLTVIAGQKFRVRAVAVDKKLIQSRQLRTRQASFYNYVIKEVLSRDDSLTAASVKLDGEAGRQYKQQAVAYFRREVNRDGQKIAKFAFVDSSKNDLIQLADLVAGAIYRSRLAEKTDHEEYIAILKPRIEEVWDFE
jgi:hypothetical protein